MSRRLKVLLSAYACEPGKGSEPEVGWQTALSMAEMCDVTVLTRRNNRQEIEKRLTAHHGRILNFIYFDLPRPVLWMKKRFRCTSLYYLIWQLMVSRYMKGKLDDFDLIHHVTFNGIQFPGSWAGCGLPVLLGPLGGGMVYPPAMLKGAGIRGLPEKFRAHIVQRILRMIPYWRKQIRSAALVLAANRETAQLLASVRGEGVEVMLETASDGRTGCPQPRGDSKASGPMKVLWLGNLETRKAPDLALSGFVEAHRQCPDIELWLAGDGPQKRLLQKQVARLGLQSCVRLMGRIPKNDVSGLMDKADVFLFTSMRDTSGNVVIEAMERGLPVIVPFHQGMVEVCDDSCAILLTVEGREKFVHDVAEALIRLHDDLLLRKRMGECGRRRVVDVLSWNIHSRRLYENYRAAVNKPPTSRPHNGKN